MSRFNRVAFFLAITSIFATSCSQIRGVRSSIPSTPNLSTGSQEDKIAIPRAKPIRRSDYPELCGSIIRTDVGKAEWDLIKRINTGHAIFSASAQNSHRLLTLQLVELEEIANALRKSESDWCPYPKTFFSRSTERKWLGYCYAVSRIEKNAKANKLMTEESAITLNLKGPEKINEISGRMEWWGVRSKDRGDISFLAREFIDGAYRALWDEHDLRVHRWNHLCHERYGYGDSILEDDLKTYLVVNEDVPSHAELIGHIDDDFASTLQQLLDKNSTIQNLTVSSYGGYVIGAMEAGELIRKRGLSTWINGTCFSACPLLFAGGVKRTAMDNKAKFGFHQIHIDGKAVPLDDEVYLEIQKYLVSLGINGEWVHMHMISALPSQMKILNAEDVCRSKLTTYVHYGTAFECR